MVWPCHLCAWRVTWSFASQTEENILLVWIIICDPEETLDLRRSLRVPRTACSPPEAGRLSSRTEAGRIPRTLQESGAQPLSKMPPQARLWEAGGSVRVWRWEQEGRCDSGARRSPHTSWQLGEPASGDELLGQATNKPAQCPSHLHINTALCPLPGFQYLSAVETWLWHSSRAV